MSKENIKKDMVAVVESPSNWISPKDFDVNNLALEDYNKKEYKCKKVMLKEKNGKPKQFFLKGAGDSESGYMYTKGIKENTITVGNKTTTTGKHCLPIVISRSNDAHDEFGRCIVEIKEFAKKELNIEDIKLPYSLSEDKEYMTIFADLIESKEAVLTKFYTDKEALSIKDVKRSKVRPLLMFSITEYKGAYRLKIQASEVHVKADEFMKFALSVVD